MHFVVQESAGALLFSPYNKMYWGLCSVFASIYQRPKWELLNLVYLFPEVAGTIVGFVSEALGFRVVFGSLDSIPLLSIYNWGYRPNNEGYKG